MAAAPVVGSAGRAEGSATRYVRRLPGPPQSSFNSFCLMCAHWHFGLHVERCTRCGAAIFWWVRNSELRLFESRPRLEGF